MKKIIKTFKKYLGEILLIIGIFIAAYNIFDFNYTSNVGLRLSDPHYYYSVYAKKFIALGFALVVAGILIIRNKKK